MAGRVHSLDYLKLLMALFVALGHSGVLTADVSVTKFVIGNGILRNAVPVFSLVSGYFLHAVVMRGKGRAWLRKALWLYSFWFAVYLAWALIVAPEWLMPNLSTPRAVAGLYVWGYLHLWYVVGLFVAGAMVLAMLRLGRATGWGHGPLVVLAVFCAVAGCVMEYLSITGTWPIPTHRYRNGIFIIYPFAALGYLLADRVARQGLAGLPRARVMGPLAGAALVLMMAEAWLVARNYGIGNEQFTEIPVSAYLCAPAAFVFFLRMNLPRPVLNLGYLSAAIYFLHAMIEVTAGEMGVANPYMVFLLGVAVPCVAALLLRGARKGRRPRPDPAP